jgi:hypothetical protein
VDRLSNRQGLSRGAWHQIAQDQIPIVLLVKDHSLISHIEVAQSMSEMDWKNVDLRVALRGRTIRWPER